MTTDLAFTPIDCGPGSAAGGRARPPPSIRSSRPKAAGEQSLAGELSASQQRWRSLTGRRCTNWTKLEDVPAASGL
jgi:hypothetical protein